MADDLISTREAAKLLDIDQKSVARHCRNETFKTAKLIAGVWLISRQEVEEYAKRIEGLSKGDVRRGKSPE